MLKSFKIIITAIAFVSIISCAKEKDESSDSIQRRILDAYLLNNYPQVVPNESGLTILSSTPGTGDTLDNYEAAYINYTTKTLGGIYQTTNDKELAKILGTYESSTYYGPKLYYMNMGSTIIGLEELLLEQREGAKITAIIPPWLTSYNYSGSQNSQENAVSIIYDVELKHAIANIFTFQLDSMQSYSNKYYNGMDSTSYGFYFKKLVTSDNDTVKTGTSVNVWYIGKLLDDFIFDTNIADSAKKYDIYNTSSTYTAMNISYYDTAEEMAENNEVKTGFAMALKKMKIGDEAVAFFYSEYGYGSSGSGSIPAYQPLVFYIKVESSGDE